MTILLAGFNSSSIGFFFNNANSKLTLGSKRLLKLPHQKSEIFSGMESE
jgi:hypothetical protein